MRNSLGFVIVTLVAGGSGWLVRGVQVNDPAGGASTPQAGTPLQAAPAALESIPAVIRSHGHVESSSQGNRNLFDYRSEPPTVIAHVVPPADAPTMPPAVERPLPQPVQPARPQFTYRYFGRFGPEENPIAAFSRDGEIVTVRPGDPIDRDFVLRSIQMESVDVEEGKGPDVRRERIPLGDRER
jgi:hypothetical protein